MTRRARLEGYAVLFALAAETGGRLSEVLGLVWKDVDLEAATVTFDAQLSRKGERATLKTARSRRCLEITADLTARLREHKLASGHSGPHDLVFANREGKGLDQRNVGGRILARAIKNAGLQLVESDNRVVQPAPTFHSLRHSHASALIAAGWDIEEVSARLGHANVATTMTIYVQEFDAPRRSADRRSRLTSLYGRSMEAPMEAIDHSTTQQTPSAATANGAQVVDLGQIRDRAQ